MSSTGERSIAELTDTRIRHRMQRSPRAEHVEQIADDRVSWR